jgi:hypothetical protein
MAAVGDRGVLLGQVGGPFGSRNLLPAAALLVGNVLDALFSSAYLQLGVAREMNPMLRVAFDRSPLLFMAVKLAAVSCGVLVLSTQNASRAARLALWAGATSYTGLVAYHLAFLARLF